MGRNHIFTIRVVLLMAVLSGASALSSQQRKSTAPPSTRRTFTIHTEPNAIVWLDEVRRGVTDPTGNLTLENVSLRRHLLRVRASGLKEVTMLLPGRRGEVNVRLVRTTNEAELTFQQAEAAREQAKDDESRQKAAELYRQALKLRQAFPAAHVGLARVLMDLSDFESALAEIEKARRYRRLYPEASAVEGRIYREEALTEQAFGSFNRALRESHGFQPEARVGLARIYEDRGWYEQAAREYRIALEQLSDTEPVIYQLLGAAYEKLEQYKEAVEAYEKYLELAPNGPLAPALRSVIDQLRRQAGDQEPPDRGRHRDTDFHFPFFICHFSFAISHRGTETQRLTRAKTFPIARLLSVSFLKDFSCITSLCLCASVANLETDKWQMRNGKCLCACGNSSA